MNTTTVKEEHYYFGIKYTIQGTTIPTVTVKVADPGTVIAVEAGRNVSFLSCTGGTYDWEIEVNGVPGRNTREAMHSSKEKKKKSFDEDFRFSKLLYNAATKAVNEMEDTEEAKVIGENPIFTYYTAINAEAEIKINNHYMSGQILSFKAEEEPLLIRQGGFLAGLETVNLDRFIIPESDDGSEKEDFRAMQLGLRYMQKVSGAGLYFLEVQGDVEEYSVKKGKTIAVDPMKLVAMSTDVRIVKFLSTGKSKAIRDNIGRNFDVVLQATGNSSKVYISSRIQKNHYELEKSK